MAVFVPKKPEKEVISMRISSDLLKKVDETADKIGMSRNELLNQCIVFAMENVYNCDKEKEC